MQDRNGDGSPMYFYVYGCKYTSPVSTIETLNIYETEREAVAYAKGFCSNPEMGGFDAVWVKAYAHEDGPYVAWSKYKENNYV